MMRTTIILLMVVPAILWATADAQTIAKPGCQDECFGVKIPYPFGIGDGCFFNNPVKDSNGKPYGDLYKLTCDGTRLQISENDTTVLNITLEDHSLRVNSQVAFECYNSEGTDTTTTNYTYLTISAFSVSPTKNKLVATGCDLKGRIKGSRYGHDYYTGCMSDCHSMGHIPNGTCMGVGCCETPIPDGMTDITTEVASWYYHLNATFNPCSSAFIVENDAFTFSTANLTSPASHFDGLFYPMALDWSILGSGSCNQQATLCGFNTTCIDGQNNTSGYRCYCATGYTGNPYLSNGCQDIDECAGENKCDKPEHCVNTQGSHECKCPKRHHGSGTKLDPCTANKGWSYWTIGVKVTTCLAGGLLFILVGSYFGHLYYQKIKLLHEKHSFFKKNGGKILKQKLNGQDMSIQKFKVFTKDELETATANYSESNVVGRGELGKVYKGTLQSGQLVAIKKSLKVDKEQTHSFIKEAAVLSEINNRNVVKLIGCCLETQVPLLVHEFINNGTLYEHLHDDGKADKLSWDKRLCIAEAVASVLSYLHTTIAKPIIHCDVKSVNILLDEKYTAKVADFGASRFAPPSYPNKLNQLTTMVSGKDVYLDPEYTQTKDGYLDPEYMQTKEFTKKSDVYSFGVVLAELLTRKKAYCFNLPEAQKYLAKHFLSKMEEDRLVDIVDESILTNDNHQVKQVAELASRCLKPRGEERPTIKEVAMELEYIRIRGRSTI